MSETESYDYNWNFGPWETVGGPAYPVDVEVGNSFVRRGGMSIRDYFAAAALRGLLNNESNPKDAAAFAADSYRFADAMIAARKAKP